MEIDTSNLTDEQISKLGEYVHKMEEENKKAIKWWIMPNFDVFQDYNPSIGLNYYVEPEEDSYSKNRPPLKSGFESKEAAEKWLKNYLAEEDLFNQAIREINSLKNNLGNLIQKLRNHQYITNMDIHDCFAMFSTSMQNGPISRVVRDNEKI